MSELDETIFISWSGDKSKKLAAALRGWLPLVLQNICPFFSDDDLEKGSIWNADVRTNLQNSKIGIICLTPENWESPWILFEAGALANKLTKTNVCTLYFQITPTDISGPLTTLQGTVYSKEGMLALCKTINKVQDNGKDEKALETLFNLAWENLNSKIEKILNEEDIPEIVKRPEREMIEEILDHVRVLVESEGKNKTARFPLDSRRILRIASDESGKITYKLASDEPTSGELLEEFKNHLTKLINETISNSLKKNFDSK